jgi:hypothetical protein
MKTLPPETTTLPNACEPRLAIHFTFGTFFKSALPVASLKSILPFIPLTKWSGRFLAGEYMSRPGSLPPQRGQSSANTVGNNRLVVMTPVSNEVEANLAFFMFFLVNLRSVSSE